jgi:dephospho-CoA kinase
MNDKRKLIIGLTGGIGSGKTAASNEFEALGISIVDADIVAREVVEPGRPALQEIAEHFGKEILSEDGTLNRATLRNIIFSSEEQKSWLENLLHPIIRTEITKQLEAAQSPYVILVSPLLFETDQAELVERILLIDVPVEIQLARASERDQNSTEQIQKIIDKQLPRDYKLEHSNDVICNDQDLDYLRTRVHHQHGIYLELSSE